MQLLRIVVATHRRNNDIIRTFRIPRVELLNRCLGFNLERRKERDSSRPERQGKHISDIGALEDAIGQQEIRSLGGVIDGNYCNYGALPFRPLKSGKHEPSSEERTSELQRLMRNS